MPNRFIKESIGTSETLALISGDEERHFWRLVVQADDFGRFDARPHVIRSRGYSAMLGAVGEEESERRTIALAEARLIGLYENGDRRYGYFPTWAKHQQIRSQASKYPDPLSVDSIRYQPLTHAPVLVSVLVSESVVESVSEKRRPSRASSPWEPMDWFKPLMDLEGYRKGNHSRAAASIEEACKITGADVQAVVKSFAVYWPMGRLKHENWNNPVKSLLRTIDIQISKVQEGGRNGRTPGPSDSGRGAAAQDDPLAAFNKYST